MEKDMKLSGAPCADGRAAAAGGADAAPERAKKPYVKPTMQVFKLNCQMLAASGASVFVRISPMPAVDYYYTATTTDDEWLYTGPWDSELLDGSFGEGYLCGGCGLDILMFGWKFGASDVVGGSSFLSAYASEAARRRDQVDDITDCVYHKYRYNFDRYLPWRRCGRGIIDTPGLTPDVFFVGADWDVQDFFENAQFDTAADDGTFSGTYNGQRFKGRIDG
ncbi:MAG: hypothetical protein IJ722_01875 [Alloprevotella sp.]|nr:hypothetical protein [Alloprevotella sp.]